MTRVQELENKIVENKKFVESKLQQIKTLKSDIEILEGKMEADELELAKAKAKEFREELLAVLEKFEDLEGAHKIVLEVVSDKFDLEDAEESVPDKEVKDFVETIGMPYPDSEIGAEEASDFVREIAEAHKDNPAAANATYYMLLDRWSHLFDLEGLAVVKDAKATMDKLLSEPPKLNDDGVEIPF